MRFRQFIFTGIFSAVFILSGYMACAQSYYVYVTAESEDEVSLVRFDAGTGAGEEVHAMEVGLFPTEIDGPHGINVSPDGKHLFVSIAHGQPFGYLHKFDTETHSLVGEAALGLFPASMEISRATGLLYIVNFNLHGDMEPSTVMVVDPVEMEVVAEIPTGIMPHGSRISPDGKRQYHVSMMTDELIEINTVSFEVSRRLPVGKAAKGHVGDMGEQHSGNHAMMAQAKPTWADPHPHKPFVYVANNGSNEIVEVDTERWEITRRFQTAPGPYNLEVSHDGKLLVVSYKSDGSTGIWDLASGSELAKIDNSRKVTHGVTISPDNRFAFLSVEGIGGEPGSVDVIDLDELKLTEVIEVGKQAGGIIFWKMTE